LARAMRPPAATPLENRSPSKAAAPPAKMRSEPLAASASYFVASVCLSLTNKAVFSRSDFDFPLSVLASQALVTVVLLLVSSETRLGPAVRFDPKLARKMLPITLLFAVMLWTSSKALRYCSVPVVTIFKNLSVVAITVFERVVYSDRSSVGVLLSLLCMIAGSVVAAAGDLQFSSVGYGWMLLNGIFTVCHLAAVRAWLRHESSSTAKTFHNQLFALVIFAGGAAAQGELPSFPHRLLRMPPSFQAGFLLSTVLGLLINLSSFWALRVTSGTTYSFVGASNKIPAALLGHFLFSSNLTAFGRPACSKCPSSQQATRPPTAPEARALCSGRVDLVQRGERARAAWMPRRREAAPWLALCCLSKGRRFRRL